MSKDQILPRPVTGDSNVDSYFRRAQHAATLAVDADELSGENITTDRLVWAPWGLDRSRVVSSLHRVRTQSATVTRLFEVEIPDGAVTKFTACITGVSATLTGTGVDLTFVVKRTGATVTAIGTLDDANREEDVAGWDATMTTSGVYLVANVTGAASTDILWMGELRQQITVWEPI